MQVYFFPPAVIVCPAVLQALPALGAVAACAIPTIRARERSIGNTRKAFRITKL
jgi:hypothetical protein